MIAAITNYYNPSRRETKWKNYCRFRESLKGIPLYIVEAAFGDEPFTLHDDNVIQVRCKSVLWQQYRLVNIGIEKLPDQFEKAVWIDADILFQEENWHHRLDTLLDDYKVVQSFDSVAMLDPSGKELERFTGVAKNAYVNSLKPTANLLSGNLDMSSKYPTGFSWGVRREIIERHGIYDYWITGSCDSAFVLAIWGDFKNPFIRDRLNEEMKQHYFEWAIPFHNSLNGSVHFLNTPIRHLWHGYRNYRKRWQCLKQFNPYTDVRIAENGALEWCSDKREMHACCEKMCRNYDQEFAPYL